MDQEIKGVEMGMATLTVTLSDSLAKFLPYVPVNLKSSDLEILVPKGGIISPGNTNIICSNSPDTLGYICF